jgi:hypothetical protein
MGASHRLCLKNFSFDDQCRLKSLRADTERFTCDLHLGVECALVFSHDPGKSDYTVTTGHRDFNRGAVFCDAKQRDNPAGDKPGVINRGADIKKYTAYFEADSPKVGR